MSTPRSVSAAVDPARPGRVCVNCVTLTDRSTSGTGSSTTIGSTAVCAS
jgi:hypothetical protein